jgi:redox-sensitive bicupin YhaK (pirin superfamily)
MGEDSRMLQRRHLGILSAGDRVQVRAARAGARFLLVSGRPLREPVARGGPFVMNTREEVVQAFDDYRYNRF